jgi:hypothetical protein
VRERQFGEDAKEIANAQKLTSLTENNATIN